MEAVSRILPVTTLAAVASDLASALAPGQAVQARVQQIISDGLYRLATPRGPIEVASQTPLPVGATVSLTVTRAEGETTLRIAIPVTTGQEAAPVSLPAATVRPAAQQAVVVTLGSSSASPTLGAASSTPAGYPNTAAPSPLLGPREGGLVPRDAGVTTPTLVSSSAPRAAAEPALAPAGTPAPARPGLAAAAQQPLLFAAIASSLTKQDGLAPLIANLAALATRPPGEIPAAARTAGDRLAALRLDTSKGVTAESVEAALERSGIFFEARLARGEAPDPRADLKSLLLALREDLAASLPTDGAEPEALLPRPDRPAPPVRGEPPAAQKAVSSTPLPEAPVELTRLLMRETEAGLARLRLAQVASLPVEAVAGEGTRAEPAPATLHATIPLGLGRETALLDLVVERDAQQRSPGTVSAPLWRVWLALDIEPAGPVTALVTLGGSERSVGVTFWAEREATERALAAALPGLRSALTAADLNVGETAARAGRPRRVTRSGRFLDTTT